MKTGKTKGNMEKDGGERKGKSGMENWSEVQMAVADRDGWQDCIDVLSATWHKEDRKVGRKLEFNKLINLNTKENKNQPEHHSHS